MALDDLVFKHRDLEISLPKSFKNLFNEIKNSKYILDLKPYYDDESAKVPSYNIWRSTIEFIANYSKNIYEKNKVIITFPEINPGRDGSVDLDFRIPCNLLINIKNENKKTIVSYYGDNYGPKLKPETKKEKESEIEGIIKYIPNKIYKPLVNWMKTYLRT